MPGPSSRFDVVVVGSGVAGCAIALRLAAAGVWVALVTKGELGASTTEWAQGGIAAAFPVEGDSAELHLADTLRAGVGLCDPEATRILVEGGPRAVLDLVALGAVFDRDERGELARSRRVGTAPPGSSTPVASRPVPRWSGRSSRGWGESPSSCSSARSPPPSSSRTGGARVSTCSTLEGPGASSPRSSSSPPAAPVSSST